MKKSKKILSFSKKMTVILLLFALCTGIFASCNGSSGSALVVDENTTYFTAEELSAVMDPLEENTSMYIGKIVGNSDFIAFVTTVTKYTDGGGDFGPIPFNGKMIVGGNVNVVTNAIADRAVIDLPVVDDPDLPDADADPSDDVDPSDDEDIGKPTDDYYSSIENTTTLILMNPEGVVTQKIDLTELVGNSGTIDDLFVDKNGVIYVFATPEFEGNAFDTTGGKTIYKYNQEGNKVGEPIVLTMKELDMENSYSYLNSTIVDENGKFYAVGNWSGMDNKGDYLYGGFVVAFDENGKEVYRCEDKSAATGNDSWSFDSLIFSHNSQVFVTGSQYGEKTSHFCMPLQDSSQNLGNRQEMDSSLVWNSGVVSTEEGLAYNDFDNRGIYIYNMDTGKNTTLLEWKDQDLNVSNQTTVSAFPLSAKKIFVIVQAHSKDTGESEYTYYMLNRADKNPNAGKKLIRIAGFYMSSPDLQKAIFDFNKTSTEYRAEYVDYNARLTQGGNEEDYDKVIKEINAEILSGSMPDVLFMGDQLDFMMYANKGLFADLYSFMEKDPDYKRELFHDSLLKALETNGQLLYMADYFILDCLVGRESYTGNINGWTIEEFENAVASLSTDVKILANQSRSMLLEGLLSASFNEYVDSATNTSKFDSQSFIDLLEFCKKYGISDDLLNNGEWVDEESLFKDGELALLRTYMSDANGFTRTWNLLQEKLNFVGFPSAERTGPVAGVSNYFAISSSSPHQQQAWDLIKTVISPKTQDEAGQGYGYGLPVRKSSLELAIDKAMNPSEDEQGGGIWRDGMVYSSYSSNKMTTGLLPGWFPDSEPMSEEAAAALRDLVNNIGAVRNYNMSLFKIVQEEVTPFFNDQKSAKETAEIIHNRIKTHLNEQ